MACHNLLELSIILAADPGPFSLARGGIYVREAGAWVVFLVFKGVDLHSGYAPSEDIEAHQAWIDSQLSPAWNLAGPQNRVGYVCYPARAATQRTAAMNMTPAQKFGNFAAAQPHKTGQSDFATDGEITLGGKEAWANRLGREIVFSMWNQLQYCNLDLGIDPNEILGAIKFENNNGEQVSLKPFPYHPIRDARQIQLLRGYYAWYHQQCASMAMGIKKWVFIEKRKQQSAEDQKKKEDKVWALSERREINRPRTLDAASVSALKSSLGVGSVVDTLSRSVVNGNVSW